MEKRRIQVGVAYSVSGREATILNLSPGAWRGKCQRDRRVKVRFEDTGEVRTVPSDAVTGSWAERQECIRRHHAEAAVRLFASGGVKCEATLTSSGSQLFVPRADEPRLRTVVERQEADHRMLVDVGVLLERLLTAWQAGNLPSDLYIHLDHIARDIRFSTGADRLVRE